MTSSFWIQFSRPYNTFGWITFVMLITAINGQSCSKNDYNPCKGNDKLFYQTANIRFTDERRCISPLNSPLSLDDAKKECKRKNSILLELLGLGFKTEFIKVYSAEVAATYKTGTSVWLNAKYNKINHTLEWLSDGVKHVRFYQDIYFSSRNNPKCFVMTFPQGLIQSMDCSKRMPFYCYSTDFVYKNQRPEFVKPAFDVNPTVYKQGRMLFLQCHGPTSPIERFSFVLKTNISKNYMTRYRFARPQYRDSIRNYEGFKDANGTCTRTLAGRLDLTKLPRNNKHYGYSAEIICRRHTFLDNSWKTCPDNDMACVKISFVVTVLNKKPTLSQYFHKPPRTMYIDRAALFTCEACVGYFGNISWSISSSDPKTNAPLLDSDDERITYKSEPSDTNTCGTMVKSNLTLTITNEMHGAKISCKSYMWHDGKRINESPVTGADLTVIHAPTQPEMVVQYNTEFNETIMGRNLTANCSSCYEQLGEISWSLLKDGDVQVELSALNITFEIENYKPAFGVIGCKIFVTSRITIQVAPDLANKSLMCKTFTYYKYFPDSKAFTKSPRLRIIRERIRFTTSNGPDHLYTSLFSDDGRNNITRAPDPETSTQAPNPPDYFYKDPYYIRELLHWFLIILIVTLISMCLRSQCKFRPKPVAKRKSERKNEKTVRSKSSVAMFKTRSSPGLHSTRSTNVDTGFMKQPPKNPKEISEKFNIPEKNAVKIFKIYENEVKRSKALGKNIPLALVAKTNHSGKSASNRLVNPKTVMSIGIVPIVKPRHYKPQVTPGIVSNKDDHRISIASTSVDTASESLLSAWFETKPPSNDDTKSFSQKSVTKKPSGTNKHSGSSNKPPGANKDSGSNKHTNSSFNDQWSVLSSLI